MKWKILFNLLVGMSRSCLAQTVSTSLFLFGLVIPLHLSTYGNSRRYTVESSTNQRIITHPQRNFVSMSRITATVTAQFAAKLTRGEYSTVSTYGIEARSAGSCVEVHVVDSMK